MQAEKEELEEGSTEIAPWGRKKEPTLKASLVLGRDWLGGTSPRAWRGERHPERSYLTDRQMGPCRVEEVWLPAPG